LRRSLILDVVVRLVFHSALLLGCFLLFTGHNRPGGGFVGGLVAGASVALRYAAGGIDDPPDTYANVARISYDAITAYADDVRAGRQIRGGIPIAPGS